MNNNTELLLNKNSLNDDLDYALRPKILKDFVGQEKIKESLNISIKAAMKRIKEKNIKNDKNETIDHIIFSGPPGLGKTTLANIIANEMNAGFHQINAPALEKKGDLLALLTKLGKYDVFFIDEIHRLRPELEEILYSAMEDFKVNIIMGQGISANPINISIPHFTLIGATTRTGLLTRPLLSRFGIDIKLDLYNSNDLSVIIKRSANLLDIKIEDDASIEIGFRSRGTPRIANRLLRRIRDYAQVEGNGIITKDITLYAFEKLEIDKYGLTFTDRKLLNFIITNCKGGPVGVNTLAVSLGETSETLEDVVEPYLIEQGYLIRTPKGRCITKKTYNLFGLKEPGMQNSLF